MMENAKNDLLKIKGNVFNIQKFSVNDGPGIRTVVFLKGCPLRCRWCANPESQKTQMQILHDQKKCVSCQSCAAVCPVKAIRYENGRIIIDEERCLGCEKCVHTCRHQALKAEGKERSVEEVMKTVRQDQVFYEESHGGLTLSGGEIMMQPEFSRALLQTAKEEGIHTCVETTGYTDEIVFLSVIEYADALLIDFKQSDPLKHEQGTGVRNEQIINNISLALKSQKDCVIRIPVIPFFNETKEDALHMAETLKNMGASEVQLLPFHQFGENKYHNLNQTYAYEDVPALHEEDLQDVLQIFINEGLNAHF